MSMCYCLFQLLSLSLASAVSDTMGPNQLREINLWEINYEIAFESFHVHDFTRSWFVRLRFSFLEIQIFHGRTKYSRKLYKIGILLRKLFWPTVRKNCSSDREKLLKFKAVGREFAKILRSLEQFIQAVKGQNNFW